MPPGQERQSPVADSRLQERKSTAGLSLLLELVLDADGDGEVYIELTGGGWVVDAVVGHHGVRRDAEDPVRGAVEIHVPADNGSQRGLVVVKANSLRSIRKNVRVKVRTAD